MKLNVRAPGNMFLGYGAASINIMKALDKLGVEISYFQIGQPQLTTNDTALLQKWINNQNTFDSSAPALTIWHENQLSERIGNGKHYALSFFELDTLNERRRHHLNSVNHLITPSAWALDVLRKNNVTTPASVVPMGVDTEIFHPFDVNRSDKYTFLVMGKWELRKGHDLIHEIFNNAFSVDDDVELWMMCSNIFLNEEETREWENYYLQTDLGQAGKIKFIAQVKTDYELAQIMNQVDCGISLSKAEGFDLPILKMMACGKKVITTNYSAHTEFCNNDNSYLIDIDELEEANDGGKWFGPGTGNEGNWAKIGESQQEQAIEHLRNNMYDHIRPNYVIRTAAEVGGVGGYVYKNNKINQAGLETAQNMTWEICGQKIKDLIFSCPPKPEPPTIVIMRSDQTSVR